jgi:hypothetical protein
MLRVAVCVLACWTLVADSPPREIRVAADGDLQAALDRAQPGDQVLLAAGARFTGSYILRARPGEDGYVTIRTDASDLPGPGVRTGPRWSGRLAVLQSATAKPALRTENGAHHWRIENVEFGPSAGGRGAIIELGAPPPGQRTLQEVAHSRESHSNGRGRIEQRTDSD